MASRFWVGGTGTWDNAATTHWSATTGGASGASAPVNGDSVTFDASSGGGTVTAAANITGLSLVTITMGAFTGTLDFATNNPNITITNSFSNNGAGTRTLNLGSGTFTVSSTAGSVWDFFGSSLTLNAGTSTIAFTGTVPINGLTIQLGSTGIVYATMTFAAVTNGFTTFLQATGTATIGTLILASPRDFTFSSGQTLAITNAFTWAGGSSTPFSISSTSGGAVSTISVATGSPTMSWASLRLMAFTGGATFTATNSSDLGGNTGITITAPSAGGGGAGVIIGS